MTIDLNEIAIECLANAFIPVNGDCTIHSLRVASDLIHEATRTNNSDYLCDAIKVLIYAYYLMKDKQC